MRLSRLSSIVLSALLAIGHSLCACPEMQLPRTQGEPAAHACCPPSEESEADSGPHDQASHTSSPCPHCSTALQGAVESSRTAALAPVERSLVPGALVAPPAPASRTMATVRAYPHPPEYFALASPERLHVSLLI